MHFPTKSDSNKTFHLMARLGTKHIKQKIVLILKLMSFIFIFHSCVCSYPCIANNIEKTLT